MRVRERADDTRSRPRCREGLDAEAPRCDGCGVRMHAACRGELGPDDRELAVSCDVPGPDFQAEWAVPFEGP